MADYVQKAKDLATDVGNKVSSAVDSAKSTAKGLGDFAFGRGVMSKVTGEDAPSFFKGGSKGSSIMKGQPDPKAIDASNKAFDAKYGSKTAKKGPSKGGSR